MPPPTPTLPTTTRTVTAQSLSSQCRHNNFNELNDISCSTIINDKTDENSSKSYIIPEPIKSSENINTLAQSSNSLLSTLAQPPKMALSWARQFNEKLATISNLLHRNFQDDHIYPSRDYGDANDNDDDDDDDDEYGTTSDAANVENAKAIGKVSRRNRNGFLRSRSNSSADPKELDMLVLKTVDWDDSDDY